MTLGKLQTNKGEFTYGYFPFYNKTHNFQTVAFQIWDEQHPEKVKADISLLVMDDDIHLKVIDLMMNDYQGFGIAPAIILEVRELFCKTIISSTNNTAHKSFTSEANWQEAIDKVWDPLRKQGLAEYDSNRGYYILYPAR